MSAGAKSTVRGEDGVEIPIEWVYPGAETFVWERDTEHWLSPMPPMELWLHKHQGSGIDRAWEEAGMEPPAMFYRFQYVGPFLYARETPEEPERMMRNVLRYREVAREHGGSLAFWQNYCRPRIERVCGELAASDATLPLSSVADLLAYGFHQTFTSLVPIFEPGMQLTAMLAGSDEDGSLAAQEVVQGGENATQAIDREI